MKRKVFTQLTRRQALGVALTAAFGAGLSACRLTEQFGREAPGSGSLGVVPGRITLARLTERVSREGVLDTTLVAEEREIEIAGQRALVAVYEGDLPGPTLRVHAGDTLRVTLVNRLNEPTNLHVHGLHVSPADKADNVFRTVPPGEAFTYEYQIPVDHPAGTYWYHPHVHHSAADQLFRGLAGAIIVEDSSGQVEEVRAAVDRLLVLKDITLNANGVVPGASMMDMMDGREGTLVLVNGQVFPAITIQPGEVQRWRIVNAGGARYYRFAVSGHEMVQIGGDAGSLREPVTRNEILLPPGKRVEVLVRGGAAGNHAISALPYERGHGMMGGGMGGGMMGRRRPVQETMALATLMVGGLPHTMPLPATLTGFSAIPAEDVLRRRTLTLSEQMGMPGMRFLIDGKVFDEHRVDQRVTVGTTEEWTILNRSVMDHPFHIHTNPFQVVAENGRPMAPVAWEDTINIPANGSITFRIVFREFAGKAVYHCHILDHEDMGMMGVVDMVAPT